LPDVTADRELAELLSSRGADTLEHPGGTLSAHLRRVQQRLAQLGASPTLQWAGGAHAAYGTDGFPVALLALGERALLARVIGPDAEQMVYEYCACDRKQTWTALAKSGRLWDRFTGDGYELSADRVRDFADLSLVNELDLVENSAAFRAEHGDFFRKLATIWEGLLSPAVSAEAQRVLG
jgi:hypothetical protein